MGSKKAFFKKWLAAAAVILFYCAVLCVLALAYGNPQWDRGVYMFQRYTLNRFGSYPAWYYNYSGTFRNWSGKGWPLLVAEMKNGIYDGEYTVWDSIGRMQESGIYKDGARRDGIFVVRVAGENFNGIFSIKKQKYENGVPGEIYPCDYPVMRVGTDKPER